MRLGEVDDDDDTPVLWKMRTYVHRYYRAFAVHMSEVHSPGYCMGTVWGEI